MTKEVIGGPRKRREEPGDPNAIGEMDGKVPPHDLQAEKAYLGAIMIDPVGLDVADWLAAEMFYSEAHRRIYEAAIALHRAGLYVDSVTIAGRLRDHERLSQVGGMAYLAELLLAPPAIAHVEAYANTIRDLHRVRCAILVCREHAARGYLDHGTAADYVGGLERDVLELAGRTQDKKHERITPLLQRVYAATAHGQTTGRMPGIPRGLRDYDERTLGAQRKKLEIVAARPAMGKSGWVLQSAINIARRAPELFDTERAHHGVAIFSLEMDADECGARMLANEARVDYGDICRQRLTPDQWAAYAAAANRLAQLPIVIDDTPALEIGALRARIRRIKAEMAQPGYVPGPHPTRLAWVAIDYLQLLKAPMERGRSRQEEVATISKELHNIAKTEDVAVTALAQLSRAATESRGGKGVGRPQLSDLRESGQIEADADLIMFIHRPGYYDSAAETPGEEGRTELIIAKQRNGPTGTALARWNGRYQTFTDL